MECCQEFREKLRDGRFMLIGEKKSPQKFSRRVPKEY